VFGGGGDVVIDVVGISVFIGAGWIHVGCIVSVCDTGDRDGVYDVVIVGGDGVDVVVVGVLLCCR